MPENQDRERVLRERFWGQRNVGRAVKSLGAALAVLVLGGLGQVEVMAGGVVNGDFEQRPGAEPWQGSGQLCGNASAMTEVRSAGGVECSYLHMELNGAGRSGIQVRQTLGEFP